MFTAATRTKPFHRTGFHWPLLSFVLAGAASAQDLTNTFLKGPYLQAPGATTMTILWESPTNKPGLVRYAS
ncbi:MAG: hypothetical protein HYY24_10720 [Verrucomicrobia bacterium]|nr:hypothetical protein [Verrucomicrobiota bacterium]